jgi:hypothetical protein
MFVTQEFFSEQSFRSKSAKLVPGYNAKNKLRHTVDRLNYTYLFLEFYELLTTKIN